MGRSSGLLILALICVGCADDSDRLPIPTEEIWPDSPEQISVAEPVTYAERGQNRYGLPGADAQPISDLIAEMVAREPTGDADEPNTFTSERGQIPCPSSRYVGQEVIDALPMVIEGVVTLHPRQYVKVPICGQDEKHYGVFTIEDDTGGIMVLRDSRIAPFTAGDRLRLLVHSAMYTFSDPTTRTIASAEIERLSPAGSSTERVIYYDRQEGPFTIDDITETRQLVGYVAQEPSNKNFSTMIMTDQRLEIPPGGAASSEPSCLVDCMETCKPVAGDPICQIDVCEETICPALCPEGQLEFQAESFPVCWEISLDMEMVRRGITYGKGKRLSVIGPVVDSYGLKIWIQRLGQVTELTEEVTQ